MRALILAVTLSLVSAVPSFAQAGAVTAGFNAGLTFAVAPDEFKDETDRDLAFAGHVTVGLARALAIRAELGRSKFKPSEEIQEICDLLGTGCTLELDHVGIGVQWGGFGERGALGLSRVNVRPYGFIGIGWYELGGDLADAFDERRRGLNGGFGLNVMLQEHVGLQFDLHIHAFKPDPDDDEERSVWLVPSAGVVVAF